MTPQEAYKIGFMMKCAELGKDPEVAATLLVKNSFDPIGAVSKALGITATAAKFLLYGIPAVGGLGLVTGGVVGHNAALAANPPADINQIKEDEKTRAYESGIARLRKSLRDRGVKVDEDAGFFG